MGCISSKNNKQKRYETENNLTDQTNRKVKLYNEDRDKRTRLLVGFHMSKGGDGVEGNFQIALNTKKCKKFDLVPILEEPTTE